MPDTEPPVNDPRVLIVELANGLKNIETPPAIPREWVESRDRVVNTLESLVTLVDAEKMTIEEAALSAAKIMDEYVHGLIEANNRRHLVAIDKAFDVQAPVKA